MLVLVLVTILGAILRGIAIERESLWFDEAVSYLVARLPIEEMLVNSAQSSHPPFYYILLHFWQLLVPATDAAVRVLGIVMSILLVPAAYWLSNILFGRRSIALWAALLVAVSPFQVLFSHELRMYSTVMLLAISATIAFLMAESTNHSYWWIAFAILSALAIYTHLFAWLLLAAIGIYTLILHRFDLFARRVILIYCLLLLLFLPWLRNILGESDPELGSMRPLLQESNFNPIKPLTGLTFLIFGMSSEFIFTGISFFLLLSFLVIFVLEVHKAKGTPAIKGLSLPVLIIVCVVGLPILVYMFRPFFLPERTLAAASPFLMIIFAWGTSRKGSPLPFLVFITVGVMFVGTLLYLIGPPVKPPYRDVIAFVEDSYKSGDAVLHTSDGSYLPALRYTSIKNHAVLAGDPDPRKPAAVYELLGGEVWNKDEVTSKGGRLWLIVALEHSVEWQRGQAAFFKEHYTLLESNEIGGIQIFLYDLLHPIAAQ